MDMTSYHNPFEEIEKPESDHMSGDFDFFPIDDRLVTEVLRSANPPHRHDYQEIIWIRRGTAEHVLDDDRTEVTPPSLLVVPKGYVHRILPSRGLSGEVIRFKDDFLSDTSFVVFNRFVALSHFQVPPEDARVVDLLVTIIGDESRIRDRHRRATVTHLLEALISKIEELKLRSLEMHTPTLKDKQRLWERFSAAVEKHFRTEHSVRFYARELGSSPRKLNDVARLFLDKGVAEAIDERLMLEARRLLLFSPMTVKEIAFDLGYDGHSYFTKVFKKIVGTTPVSFRERSAQITA